MATTTATWRGYKVLLRYHQDLVPPPATPSRNAIGYFFPSPPTLKTLNIVWSKRRVTWKEATGAPRPPKYLPLPVSFFTKHFYSILFQRKVLLLCGHEWRTSCIVGSRSYAGCVLVDDILFSMPHVTDKAMWCVQ